MDHVARDIHVISWTGAEIMDREGHHRTRQVKESICIRKQNNCMNRNAGACDLLHVYDRLLIMRVLSCDHYLPDEVH